MAGSGSRTGPGCLDGSLPRPVQIGAVVGLALLAVAAVLLGPRLAPGAAAGAGGRGGDVAVPGSPGGAGVPASPEPGSSTGSGVSVAVTGTGLPVDTGNPAENRPPGRSFYEDCSAGSYDDSVGCTSAALAALDSARTGEGLGPMVLPSDWYQLGPAQQLFVATNLERTARNLPPLAGLTPALDRAAAVGARSSTDPEPPSGLGVGTWGANWAGALGNPLQVVYLWMYDDGPGSANVDCHRSSDSGCWGHRENVVLALDCQPCLMGVAADPTGYRGTPGWAEILADVPAGTPVTSSWSAIAPDLSGAEVGS
jgi:hypothetical protein